MRIARAWLNTAVLLMVMSVATDAQDVRTIDITAARDNTFRVAGSSKPILRLKVGETVRLRITAERAEEAARDSAVHSLVIRSLREQGWDFRLYEGTKEFMAKAPEKPGEYVAECTVKCGRGHDDMRMKIIVER